MPQLYAHNRASVEILKKNPRYALFADLGTGKTPCILTLLSEVNDWYNAVIIVPAYLIHHWKKEHKDWAHKIQLIDLHNIFKTSTNSDVADGKALAYFLPTTPQKRIWLISYSMIRSRKHTRIVEYLHLKADVVVLDESLAIANPKAQITQLLTNPTNSSRKRSWFAPAKRKYILCGKPMTESELQIFCQYKFIRPALFGMNYYDFRSKYFEPDYFGHNWNIKKSWRQHFQSQLNSMCIRVRRDEVMAYLPGHQRMTYTGTLTASELAVYIAIGKSFGIKLGDLKYDTETALAVRTKQQQITAGYLRVVPKSTEEGFLAETIQTSKHADRYTYSNQQQLYIQKSTCSREKLLHQILAQLPIGAKFIVFCAYKPEVAYIQDYLYHKTKYATAAITGDTDMDVRERIRQDVQDTDRIDSLNGVVATTASLAKGHNYSQVAYLIYYTHVHSFDIRDQSEARPQRPGQTQCLSIIDIVMEDTIDEDIQQAYSRKMDLDKWLKVKEHTA